MEDNCKYLEGCPMFKHFRLDSTKEMYITLYCKGDYNNCARKKLREAGQPVPEKLLPNNEYLT